MNEPVPEDCVAPAILPECVFAHKAFSDLTADRSRGFEVGPIPWASIDAYAQRYGIFDIDEFDEFNRMIRVMDNVFIAHHAK